LTLEIRWENEDCLHCLVFESIEHAIPYCPPYDAALLQMRQNYNGIKIDTVMTIFKSPYHRLSSLSQQEKGQVE
jgi:hypothetical protein